MKYVFTVGLRGWHRPLKNGMILEEGKEELYSYSIRVFYEPKKQHDILTAKAFLEDRLSPYNGKTLPDSLATLEGLASHVLKEMLSFSNVKRVNVLIEEEEEGIGVLF